MEFNWQHDERSREVNSTLNNKGYMHQEVTPKINDTRGRCKAIGDTAFNTTKGEQNNDEQNAWHYNTTIINIPEEDLLKANEIVM